MSTSLTIDPACICKNLGGWIYAYKVTVDVEFMLKRVSLILYIPGTSGNFNPLNGSIYSVSNLS